MISEIDSIRIDEVQNTETLRHIEYWTPQNCAPAFAGPCHRLLHGLQCSPALRLPVRVIGFQRLLVLCSQAFPSFRLPPCQVNMMSIRKAVTPSTLPATLRSMSTSGSPTPKGTNFTGHCVLSGVSRHVIEPTLMSI